MEDGNEDDNEYGGINEEYYKNEDILGFTPGPGTGGITGKKNLNFNL